MVLMVFDEAKSWATYRRDEETMYHHVAQPAHLIHFSFLYVGIFRRYLAVFGAYV